MNKLAMEMCSLAISYADRGWPVLPLWGLQDGRCACGRPDCPDAGKHPCGQLAPHGLKDATTDGGILCDWWESGKTLNIGIRTGPESGIVVVDEDPRHGGDLSTLGALPETATVRTGGGGRHLFFVYPAGLTVGNSRNKLGPGLDVRATNGYVVTAPSLHISGRTYEWERRPEEVVASLPESILSLLFTEKRGNLCSPFSVNKPVSVKEFSVTPPNHVSVTDEFSVNEEVDAVIKRTLPEAYGNRNRCIFALAQRLKAIPAFASKEGKALEPIVRVWHSRAQPHIETKTWEPTWLDFLYAWRRVRHPKGEKMATAIELAKTNTAEPPEAAGYENETVRLLVRLCWQLQHLHGREPFHLSFRAAGEQLGVSHTLAGRYIELLLVDGIIAIAKAHTSVLATRYKYIGPSGDSASPCVTDGYGDIPEKRGELA